MEYRAPRWPADFPVAIYAAGGASARVQVTNVGPTGMRVSGLSQLVRGQRVKVAVTGHFLDGVVRWSRGDTCGVELDHRMSDDVISILRRLPRRPMRPGRKGGPSSSRGPSGFKSL